MAGGGRAGGRDRGRGDPGLGPAHAVGGDGSPAGTCDDDLIDTLAACSALYSTPAVSRFQDFNGPRSWECWG
ncbi:hypothetical protein [Nonomuraea candida]|uniref:hypothetical protein n=1 Tax=Nonomuraea candida TaxID=359159 RepID=UPI0005BCF7BC|nr:hypothetical protein [Nonomuraea candida]